MKRNSESSNKHDKRFISKIIQIVSDDQGISIMKMQEKTRKREIVQARQIAMFFASKYTNCSLAIIGDEIGCKDHATVLYAKKTISNLIETDRDIRFSVDIIDKRIQKINHNNETQEEFYYRCIKMLAETEQQIRPTLNLAVKNIHKCLKEYKDIKKYVHVEQLKKLEI